MIVQVRILTFSPWLTSRTSHCLWCRSRWRCSHSGTCHRSYQAPEGWIISKGSKIFLFPHLSWPRHRRKHLDKRLELKLSLENFYIIEFENHWAGTVNSSREYLLAAENIFFWYSLPLKNEWGMTTATRTLDLSCPALGPGPGLQHGQNELMLNTLLFSIEHKKCFYYGNMQILKKHFPF